MSPLLHKVPLLARAAAVSAVSATVGLGLFGAGSASAAVTVSGVTFGTSTVSPNPNNPEGAFVRTPVETAQAGAHQDFDFSVSLDNGQSDDDRSTDSSDDPENVRIDLPKGFIANANDVPKCSDADFATDKDRTVDGFTFQTANCPSVSEVGETVNDVDGVLNYTDDDGNPQSFGLPIQVNGELYLLNPRKGSEAARIGIILHGPRGVKPIRLNVPVTADDAGDYHLTSIVQELPRQVTLYNDPPTYQDRFGTFELDVTKIKATLYGTSGTRNVLTGAAPADGVPFAVMPSECGTASGSASVQQYGSTTYSASTSGTLAVDGCDKVPFEPKIAVTATDSTQGAVTGATVDVTAGRGTATQSASPIKSAQVVIPLGLNQPPASVCTQSQFGAPGVASNCPAASKIGTVLVDTPAAGQLTGDVFFGTSAEGLAVYIQAVDATGTVLLKLTGTTQVGATSLTTTLPGLPAVLVTRFKLDLASPLFKVPCTVDSAVATGQFANFATAATTTTSSTLAFAKGNNCGGGTPTTTTPTDTTPTTTTPAQTTTTPTQTTPAQTTTTTQTQPVQSTPVVPVVPVAPVAPVSPAAPAAPADTTAAKVSVPSSTTSTRAGRFKLVVSCPTGESSCAGKITLKAKTGSGKKAKTVTIAATSYSTKGGTKTAVRFRLTSAGRKLLKKGSFKATFTATVRDAAGNTSTTTKTVTIKRGKK